MVLVEPQLTANQTVIDWHPVEQGAISKAVLYYDDIADPSNTYIKSWQDFYNSGDLLNENPPFSGCSSLFKNGLTCFGGITIVSGRVCSRSLKRFALTVSALRKMIDKKITSGLLIAWC